MGHSGQSGSNGCDRRAQLESGFSVHFKHFAGGHLCRHGSAGTHVGLIVHMDEERLAIMGCVGLAFCSSLQNIDVLQMNHCHYGYF